MQLLYKITVSIQQSAVSRELKAHAARTALWHRLQAYDITQHYSNVDLLSRCSRSWGKPRQLLMGETTAVAHGGDPQDRAASPRPRCLPKTALHRLFKSTDLVACA
ncbi:MAG: hypothetical protein F6J90_12500 [Moorea sp. SIOASIH]|uniref:hypothetical protein n=1 Tax=Moorena sp. SIOASIH TaxID=2607817 RepID=UPI0013B760F0|nr:hypothetical protein [Moorena sp. SIOASIH]NEO37087.1 hypothetical protein [Moorena sp. SIOASIH]